MIDSPQRGIPCSVQMNNCVGAKEIESCMRVLLVGEEDMRGDRGAGWFVVVNRLINAGADHDQSVLESALTID